MIRVTMAPKLRKLVDMTFRKPLNCPKNGERVSVLGIS